MALEKNFRALRPVVDSDYAKAAPLNVDARRQGFVPTMLLCLGLLLFCQSNAVGQEKNPQRGFQPGNAYSLTDIEAINTTNGNMILNFPLGRIAPGRAEINQGFGLRYNSKLYDSDIAEMVDSTGMTSLQTHLIPSEHGGWSYAFSTSYRLEFVSRNNVEGGPYQCTSAGPDTYKASYIWKVKVIYPDGGEHEFRPNGFSDLLNDGYFNVDPSTGEIRVSGFSGSGCYIQTVGYAANPMTYYSTDGTYTRLTINRGTGWTLSFPDGSRALNDYGGGSNSGANKLFDRNNNNVINSAVVTLPNGHVVTATADEFGRYIAMEHNQDTREDYIYSLGFNNQVLMWTVKWKSIFVIKPYRTTAVSGGIGRGNTSHQTYIGPADVVESITLPAQLGNLSYQFSYNAWDFDPKGDEPTDPSLGWGEVRGITLPSGAQVSYQYSRDGGNNGIGPNTRNVLDNSISHKTLSYLAEYDGAATAVNENWSYSVSALHRSSTVTGPDGGVTSYFFNDTSLPTPGSGLVYKEVHPDGTVIERNWVANSPSTATGFSSSSFANFFVKTEYRSITDAAGNLVKTAVKDFDYDKNGNITKVAEYDWVDYGPPNGVPAAESLKRVSTSTYWRPTPNFSDTSSNTGDSYWNASAPTLRAAVFSNEIGNGSTTLARSEATYDNPGTTGNLTQLLSWDSSKGALNSSAPILTGANSIATSRQYAGWSSGATGKLILTTDARGTQTLMSYGPVGGFEIYPTQVQSAYGTAVQRTETRDFDFSSGVTTRVTDVDNNVSTSTNYDLIARPVLVRAAEGKPEETRTATEYSDTLRRVIVRSDFSTLGDGKLVTIQHFDQLGRVRLSRQLEDSATQSAADETLGIKVQTRYLVSGANNFVLNSNPYRAATSGVSGELTMGWTRTTTDNAGRLIEVQTFGGAALPAAWGGNSASTGTVTTAYDAYFTTVTDQASKMRRSAFDALGRVVRVDEQADNGSLGSNSSPAQPTSYTFDGLSNLTRVDQGSQFRTFAYGSLGRLNSASNPETGTVNYQYDNNGNLLVKSDARSASMHASYDALNRQTRRWYNGSSSVSATTHNSPALPAAPTSEVNFVYDSQGLPGGAPTNFVRGSSAGRLVAVTYGGGSAGDYFRYDVLGRPGLKIQQTGAVNYQVSAAYNPAGALTQETYPSGRNVSYAYDGAGRASSVTGTLGDGTTRTYTTAITYSAMGGLRTEQFGTDTPIYNKMYYNSRGQLSEIRESTILSGTDWNRGAIINFYSNQPGCWGASCNVGGNNGNLMKQENWIPDNEQVSSYQTFTQTYTYDYVNRLKSVNESKYVNGSQTGTPTFRQAFLYDIYGNRRIDTNPNETWGGVNNLGFEVETATNRLYSPGDLALPDASRRIRYDIAGNQTSDTYTGQGARNYDGDNRMTQAWANGQWQSYTYDASGQRVRRSVNNEETWQVYGLGGELVSEYSANAAPTSPQKEYGYRNGQLLITAASPTANPPTRTNVALAANGATATAQNYTQDSVYPGLHFQPSYAIDGVRHINPPQGDLYWRDEHGLETWLQIDFNGSKTINEIDVVTCANHPAYFTDPAAGQTFSDYGVTAFDVYYWTGNAWALVPNASVTGNNLVWKKIEFTAITTAKIKLVVKAAPDGVARIVELEAWTPASGGQTTTYQASTNFSGTQGQQNWYYLDSTGAQMTYNAGGSYWEGPQSYLWLWANGGHPGPSADAVRQWRAAQAGSVHITGNVSDANTGCGDGVVVTVKKNSSVLWQQTIDNGNTTGFSYDLTTSVAAGDQINFVINNRTGNNYCDGTNFDPTVAFTTGGSSAAEINWLVADQLGTPRMVFDKTGSLANLKRHDYLPFGEELFAGMGQRTAAQGFSGDSIRQKFTSKERDFETGLDYFINRYYSSLQGRFTSADPLMASANTNRPQTWNRYSYVVNNPLRLVDPNGLEGKGDEEQDIKGKKKSLKLPEHVVEQIKCALGPGVFQDPNLGEIQVNNTGNLVQTAIDAATEIFNDAFEIGADNNGLANTGVDPGTTEQSKSKEETDASVSGGATGKIPTINISPGESKNSETARTNNSLEVRQSRLDSKITTTSAHLAEQVHDTPLRGTRVSTGERVKVYINEGYADQFARRIMNHAKIEGISRAASLRPQATTPLAGPGP